MIPILQKKLYTYIPFKEDETKQQKYARNVTLVEKVEMQKKIREEKRKITEKWPELNSPKFFEKIVNDNLTLEQNEISLDNHIISCMFYKCGPVLAANEPGAKIDPDNYKQQQGKRTLEEIKNKLRGEDGVIQKIALYQARIADLQEKENR